VTLEQAREYAAGQLAGLPPGIRGLAPADSPYPVEVSAELSELNREVSAELAVGHVEGNQT
jgi:hypothetical protein